MRMLLVLAGLIAIASAGSNWAVLVAGSNTYGNYRHQSDIYHMYQILKRGGFPDDNIVVMHYDDIANNRQNPYPGEVINKPGGDNVYVDVPKDYTGADVTADNFLAVITGDDNAVPKGKKVIHPTAEDNVFIYYSDHGAVGLVAMPSGGYLYAKDLNNALLQMSGNKQYKRLVFYLEACESGSMFEDVLPDDIEIYTTTASNAHESSYACYYDSDRRAYLGDLYSVNFMEDIDANDPKSENLQQNFEITRDKTDLSHVMQYGVLDWTTDYLAGFVTFNESLRLTRPRMGLLTPITDGVDSRDVPLMTLKQNLLHASGFERKMIERAIAEEEAHRAITDRRFNQLRNVVNFAGYNVAPITSLGDDFDHECHKALVEGVERHCGRFSDYSLKYVRHLAEYCAANVPVDEVLYSTEYICRDTN